MFINLENVFNNGVGEIKLDYDFDFTELEYFDIHAKLNETCRMFDDMSPAYLSLAYEALDALAGKIPYAEINTGAIARGYRTAPYPAPFLLKELRRLGFGAVISSDCHHKDMLDCHYEEAAELLRTCGFRERYILDSGGFRAVSL